MERVQFIGYVSVKAREEKDIKAYNQLPQDEKIGLRNYIELLFKHNRWMKELEFSYQEISFIAKRVF